MAIDRLSLVVDCLLVAVDRLSLVLWWRIACLLVAVDRLSLVVDCLLVHGC